MPETLLIVEDEPLVRESLAQVLAEEGFRVLTAPDGETAIARLGEVNLDALITDLRMPGLDGLAVLRAARERSPQTLVLVMTAYASVETAIEALRLGASDYFLKPLLFDDVLRRLRQLLEHRQLAWEIQCLRRELERPHEPDALIGESPAMREVMNLIARVGPTMSTVLIVGESGTGKEVVARALHRASPLCDRVFLPVNCAAIPEALLESQLFGHLRGSFTGAVSTQEGLFVRARGGTIFLDEIGDLPLGLQVKLLRAIEEKEVLPIGGSTPQRVEVRVIASTNRDLQDDVEQGRFRPDLYYRLAVVEIHLPPLRERREDIPLLGEYLVQRHNRALRKHFRGLDSGAVSLLMGLPWKGNVRELDNCLERAMILGDGEWITADMLQLSAAPRSSEPAPRSDNLRETLRVYERSHIETVLRRTGRDKRAAARLLGLSLSSLYRKLDELHIPL